MENQSIQKKIQVISGEIQDNKYIFSYYKGLSTMMPIILA